MNRKDICFLIEKLNGIPSLTHSEKWFLLGLYGLTNNLNELRYSTGEIAAILKCSKSASARRFNSLEEKGYLKNVTGRGARSIRLFRIVFPDKQKYSSDTPWQYQTEDACYNSEVSGDIREIGTTDGLSSEVSSATDSLKHPPQAVFQNDTDHQSVCPKSGPLGSINETDNASRNNFICFENETPYGRTETNDRGRNCHANGAIDTKNETACSDNETPGLTHQLNKE